METPGAADGARRRQRPAVPTHINAYDLDLYLRIALELYLKRLMVGGIEKVYEIGRIFRNEGVDATHNPEFTMLEAYEAYGDYNTMADAHQGADPAGGGGGVRRPGGPPGDGPRSTTSAGSGRSRTRVRRDLGGARRGDRPRARSEQLLRALCARAGRARPSPGWNHGQIVLEMYERLVEERTVVPTFYRDFPVEVSPLTRAHRDDPRLAERWDLVAFGTEIGTGYSELVDPVEERARLTAQSLLAAGGDPEAMQLDEEFLQALEYGMPPYRRGGHRASTAC